MPVFVVAIVNDENVGDVPAALITPPTEAVPPSVPVAPAVAVPLVPPMVLVPVPGLATEPSTQSVVTNSGPLAWQIDTEPEPALSTTTGPPAALTAVSDGGVGSGRTILIRLVDDRLRHGPNTQVSV